MAGRAFLAFILFFLIANPLTYKVTRKVFGGIASTDGLPTQVGVLLHAFVFVMLSKFVMRRFSGYKGNPKQITPKSSRASRNVNYWN
jgi:hypothetical protein